MVNDRKQEIVQATLDLAAKNGLGTVSMQQIADRVGITKASLYNHYSSKDEIVESMYEMIRQSAKERSSKTEVDYDALTSTGSLKSILSNAVGSYKTIVNDPQLFLFYKIIMTQRPISSVASEIMVRETRTMIDATKALFCALEKKSMIKVDNLDASAFSFAMAVHSIMDYELDLAQAGITNDRDMMGEYIDEFCRIYGI